MELNQGDFEGARMDEVVKTNPEFLQEWAKNPAELVLPGGESMRQLEERAWGAITKIAASYPHDAKVAAVNPNLTICTILCKVLSLSLNLFRNFEADPGGNFHHRILSPWPRSSCHEQHLPFGSEQSAKKMKFVADKMLGKLARWMRFMGLDVLYRRPFPDNELIDIARNERRILITRDRKIIEDHKAGRLKDVLQVLEVTEDLPFDQLVDIISEFNLDPFEHAFTRCAACNGILIERSKNEVAGRVPPFVYSKIEEYRECPGCGKIFWSGTHRAKIERILAEVRAKAQKK